MNMLPFSMVTTGFAGSLAVTTTTGNELIPAEPSGNQIMFSNTTSQGCYIVAGGPLVEATSDCMFLPGNTMRVFSISPNDTHVAAITPTGTTTIVFARGNGY